MSENRFEVRVWDKVKQVYVHNDYLAFKDNRIVVPLGYHNPKDCTISQFTGLLDKNGKKIFEGDIIKWENSPAIDQVKLEMYKDHEYELDACFGYCAIYTEGTVIGNIFENPHLIKNEN